MSASDLDATVLADLRKKLGGTMVDQLIELFSQTAKQRWEALAEALQDGDAAAAGAALHSIRGSAQLVGAVRLEEVSAKWELRARTADSTALGASLAEIRAALDGVERALEDL